jgi:hypothetical protein
MASHTFHFLVRSYIWVAVAAFALVVVVVAAPVILNIGLYVVGFCIAPVFIVWSIYTGDYANAVSLSLFYALFLYVVLKNVDKILHAIAWVRVVVGGLLFKGRARPGSALTVVYGGKTMSDNSLERRSDPALQIEHGDLLGTVEQSIKARLAAKTAEEMTKVLQAKTDLYTADTNLGQARLVHDDTAVELDPKNRAQRSDNKQAELDIKTIERELALKEATKKREEANANDGKTRQQLEEELFERKRMYRSVDAQDEVFEDFTFGVTKDIELAREYFKSKKQIENDKGLDDEVRNDLLQNLKRDYKARLAKEGKAREASSGA